MQFISTTPISEPMAAAITRAVKSIDAFAQLRIDPFRQHVLIEGELSAHQASAALHGVGCDAKLVEDESDANCCGCCCGAAD